ncbi:MAG: NAD(P)-dependent oxidoreductase [Gammaproteobacteria bacterium]|nr:NAD(P)-dependent oxidoreductase [Gammaproteobacteria bacterium]
MSDKVAWITGAGGFLGRHTAKVFNAAGWQVHGLGTELSLNSTTEHWGFASFNNNCVTTETLSQLLSETEPHVVVHCAGGSSVALSYSHPEKDFNNTVDSLVTLLEFIRRQLPRTKIIYPSSAAVYGLSGAQPLSEESELSPCSPYGVNKLIAEQLLKSYSQSFGLDTRAVRFFSLYGCGLQKQILWDACNKLQNNNYLFGGTGNETRDFLHISDAAALLLKTTEIPNSDKYLILNGGSGISSTIAAILKRLAELSGSSIHPVFNGTVRSGDPQHLVSDSSKAKALGWSPSVTLDNGLNLYIEWHQNLHGKQ